MTHQSNAAVLLEADVRRNRDDLAALTNQVTKIATIVEGSEKRHESDIVMWREALAGIKQLNEGVNKTLLLEKDVAALFKEDSRQDAEIRILKHDITDIKNAQQSLVYISEMRTKIEAFENLSQQIIGGGKAVEKMGKGAWTVITTVAGGVGVLVGWGISIFF